MPSAASTAVSGGCRNPQIWFLPQSRGPGLGADGFRGTWSPRQSWGQAEGRRCRAGGNSRSGHITASAGAGGGPVGPRDLARPSPRLPLPRRLSPPPRSPHSEPSGPGSGGARGCTCVRSVCLLHVRSTWLRCKIPSTSTQASAFLLPLETRRRHVQVFVSRNCRGVGRRWMSRWEMGADVARGTAWLWFTTGAVRSASASGRAGTLRRGARGLRIGARGDARRGLRRRRPRRGSQRRPLAVGLSWALGQSLQVSTLSSTKRKVSRALSPTAGPGGSRNRCDGE